jgi:hypothetical protein
MLRGLGEGGDAETRVVQWLKAHARGWAPHDGAVEDLEAVDMAIKALDRLTVAAAREGSGVPAGAARDAQQLRAKLAANRDWLGLVVNGEIVDVPNGDGSIGSKLVAREKPRQGRHGWGALKYFVSEVGRPTRAGDAIEWDNELTIKDVIAAWIIADQSKDEDFVNLLNAARRPGGEDPRLEDGIEVFRKRVSKAANELCVNRTE